MTNRIKQLEAQLTAATQMQTKVDIMNQLAWELRKGDPRRGLVLGQTAYELSQTGRFKAQPYQKGLAESLHNLGRLNLQLRNDDLALSQLFKALSLFEAMNDVKAQADVLRLIGRVYRRTNDALQQQRQVADSLREVATILNSSLDLKQVLAKIVEQLRRVVQYDSAAVFLKEGDHLILFNGANLQRIDIGYQVTIAGDHPIACVFKQRKSLIIADVDQETSRSGWPATGRIRSWIGTPLLTDRNAIGVLTVAWAEVDAYHEADAQILQTFADQAALAIRNARQVEHTGEALHSVALLYRLGSILAKTSDIREGVEKALGEYLWALSLNQGSVALFDPDKRERELQSLYLNGQPQAAGLRLTDMSPAYQRVIRTGRPLAITDARRDPLLVNSRAEVNAHNIKSMLLAPLIVRGEVIGLLSAEATDYICRFSEQEKDLAQAVADQIATAVENARLLTEEQRQRRLAESRNKELDAFARTVAHDIKNPLGTIVLYADFLVNHCSSVEPYSAMGVIKKIQHAATKGANIIDELLLLAGIRKQQVTCQALDMAYIVVQVEQRLDFMIEEHQGEIIYPQEWPVAKGYAPWIEEVWVNYLSNGLKYGGYPPRLTLGANVQADGMIRFWVQDNGPGLDREAQANVFTEFTRLDEVRAQGHGLGLSIVRRIVEKLGGYVGVESDAIPGQGCVFYFTLPGAE